MFIILSVTKRTKSLLSTTTINMLFILWLTQPAGTVRQLKGKNIVAKNKLSAIWLRVTDAATSLKPTLASLQQSHWIFHLFSEIWQSLKPALFHTKEAFME